MWEKRKEREKEGKKGKIAVTVKAQTDGAECTKEK